MKTVAETLGVARSNLHDKVRQAAKPRASYRKPDDDYLLPLVRRLIGERPTYGYRRITALANRELGRTGEPVNHKRMFRIMGGIENDAMGRVSCQPPGGMRSWNPMR